MIEIFQGTDQDLYMRVSPLVMNPDVLKANNNYPFKTGENFTWFLYTIEDKIKGFLPVELRNNIAIINNYYVIRNKTDVLSSLLKEAKRILGQKNILTAVVQTRDIPVFEENGFNTVREWKKYVKMTWEYEKSPERL